MTEQERIQKAIEQLKERYELGKLEHMKNVPEYVEALGLAISALELKQELLKRKMTPEVLEEYMKFEDECVQKGFTFGSLLDARDKQIPKKPLQDEKYVDNKICPICGDLARTTYCGNCGNRLKWSEENE